MEQKFFKAITLGDTLRRQVERRPAKVRDVLLAEEKRMGDALCDRFNEEGRIYDFESSKTIRFRDYEYVLGFNPWEKKWQSADISYPISLSLDVVQGEKSKRFFQMIFSDSEGEVLATGEFCLDEDDAFERRFKNHWDAQRNLMEASGSSSIDLVEAFDVKRRDSHIFSFLLPDDCANDAKIRLSREMSKDLFSFIATLWPHRDNPSLALLANSYTIGNHYE